jgi:hypothetical protein
LFFFFLFFLLCLGIPKASRFTDLVGQLLPLLLKHELAIDSSHCADLISRGRVELTLHVALATHT